MQIDHPLMTGLLMETIDVLGHETLNVGLRFQMAQRQMSRIRPGARDVGPSLVTARPVPFAYSSITHKFAVLNGLTGSPRAGRITIGRDSRVLADPGSGQHHEPGMLEDKVPELTHAGLPRHADLSDCEVEKPETARCLIGWLRLATAARSSLRRTGISLSVNTSSKPVTGQPCRAALQSLH